MSVYVLHLLFMYINTTVLLCIIWSIRNTVVLCLYKFLTPAVIYCRYSVHVQWGKHYITSPLYLPVLLFITGTLYSCWPLATSWPRSTERMPLPQRKSMKSTNCSMTPSPPQRSWRNRRTSTWSEGTVFMALTCEDNVWGHYFIVWGQRGGSVDNILCEGPLSEKSHQRVLLLCSTEYICCSIICTYMYIDIKISFTWKHF